MPSGQGGSGPPDQAHGRSAAVRSSSPGRRQKRGASGQFHNPDGGDPERGGVRVPRLSPCVLVQPDGWARGEREGYGGPRDVTSLPTAPPAT